MVDNGSGMARLEAYRRTLLMRHVLTGSENEGQLGEESLMERSDPSAATEGRYADYTVYDMHGEKIGEVVRTFVTKDDRTEYIGVKVDLTELRSVLIPMDATRVSEQRQTVEVCASKQRVEDAPILDDDEITPEFERQVRDFFEAAIDRVLEVPSVDWIVPFLLVCLWERDRYGYELTRRMIALGFETTHPGVMYRTLRQMEKEGMVVSERNGFDRRPSRWRYSITELGEAYLEYLASALSRYRKEVDLFFGLYDEMSR